MDNQKKLEEFLEKNPGMRPFQRLIEKRLEGVTDPVERYTIIFGMIQGNLLILQEQTEEIMSLFKSALINKK